ncbi:MAG: glycosyltransferase family 2 protein [Candidatus Levyibacteriota bacterium]
MKKITVVTVNFNSEKETHNLLNSLKNVVLKKFDLSVIVIDNASTIPFVLSKEEEKQSIQLFKTEKNLGFSGGYNMGIKNALENEADYVVVLNNDTVVDPECFDAMLQTAEEYTTCGIVVPKIYFAKNHEFHKDRYKESEKGKVIWYAGGFMDWANVFSKHKGVDEVDTGQYDTEEKIDFATGCCMFIPKSVLEKVGMFDDKLFLYFEDADLSQRVLRRGLDIIYNPKAVIWHVNAASGGGSGSSLHDYYLTRNRMVFGLRYAPLKTQLALIKESVRLFLFGRKWQRIGIRDFYMHIFGKGSFVS